MMATDTRVTTTSPLDVQNITVAYREDPVVEDVSFSLPAGSLVAIIGPNGAGKSTLLKAMLDLIPRRSGTVRFFGQPYRDVRTRVAYVPQRSGVDWDFPVTALDVVLMGTYGRLGWFRRPGADEKQRAKECLEHVSMSSYSNRQIRQLSGGQQQRVFLARALAQDAQIYFMDEPFSGVDAATEQAIVELLQELRANGKTVLVVHHELQTVKEYFDYVILLNMRLVAAG